MFSLLAEHLKGRAKVLIWMAPLAMVVEVAMDLLQPTLMAHIIDQGVLTGNSHVVWTTAGLMILAAFAGLAGGALCSIWALEAATSLAADLRDRVFAKILGLSPQEWTRFGPASLINRCTNDVLQVQNMVAFLLRGMVRVPLLLLGSMVMAAILSPKLSLLFLVVIPLVAVSVTIVLARSSSLFVRVQSRLDQVNAMTREGLLGLRVTKAFGLEKRQDERFDEANQGLNQSTVQAQSVNYSLLPVVTLVMNLAVVAVLWFGGHLAIEGGLETGRIMAFINYLIQISASVMMAVGMITPITRAVASTRRIREVVDSPSEESGSQTSGSPSAPAIEFRNVTFRYPGAGRASLSDLNFVVPPGEHWGVIGPTGSGKTTLAGLIPRLFVAQHGQVLVDGVDVRDWNSDELRCHVGLVTQQAQLFSGTVASNLRLGKSGASDEELWQALELAQGKDFVAANALGLGARMEGRGRNWSGGQKQRLSLARVFVQHAPILILDDASSALDAVTEANLRRALDGGPPRTRLTVAQRVSSIRACDQILVIDDGRIAAHGRHEELIKTSDLYRAIVVSQWGQEGLNE